MQFGISGDPVSTTLRYSDPINRACELRNIGPKLVYAIDFRESISGEIDGLWPDAATQVASDGGKGLGQLTPPPAGCQWADPYQNVLAAIDGWIAPALTFWSGLGYTGDVLVRLIADEYNEGRTAAWYWHTQGDADAGTTNHYGAGVLAYYRALVNTGSPR